MSTRRMYAVAALLTALASCRYQPSTVPLQGSPADIAKLRGVWDGAYSSVESGRSGSITFTIRAGNDTAFGDVIMTPTHEQPLIAADIDHSIHRQHSASSEWLQVAIIRIDGGLIRGELESYIAPDCRCPVTTVFRGAVKGDRIDGSFVTRGPSALLQEGSWYVERRPRQISSR